MYSRKLIQPLILLLVMIPGSTSWVYGQLRGSHLLGFFALDAGTQTPPGISVVALPAYVYTTSTLKDGNGEKLAAEVDLTSYANGLGPAWVTNAKILGANFGGSMLVSFVTNRIEAANTTTRTTYAFSDLYVQPVQLGWKGEKADFMASYQVYMPTGRYEVGGHNNAGLGQWGHEVTGATTLKFGKKRTIHFATAISYEINSKKKDTELKTGNNLSIEGGLGNTWYKKSKGPVPIIITAGMIYYMQFKTTDDQVPAVNLPVVGPASLELKKDHIYGLGAEGNIYIPAARSAFVLRWISEFGASTRFQGSTFILMWAYTLKSFPKTAEEH